MSTSTLRLQCYAHARLHIFEFPRPLRGLDFSLRSSMLGRFAASELFFLDLVLRGCNFLVRLCETSSVRLPFFICTRDDF